MSTIQTHSGRLIDLKNIKPSDINIQDMVHGLSAIRRFNGRGISVLHHTLAMFDFVKADNVTGGVRQALLESVLIHDLAESYIGDIIQPVKAAVPQLAELENQVHDAILMHLWQTDTKRDIPHHLFYNSDFALSKTKHHDLLAMAGEYDLIFGDSSKTDTAWGINQLQKSEVIRMRSCIVQLDESKDGGKANRERLELLLLRLYAGLSLEG